MKQLNIMLALLIFCLAGNAQTDTTKTQKSDTIKVGNILIITKGKESIDTAKKIAEQLAYAKKQKSRITTNWVVVDLGFSNFTDKTNYGSAAVAGSPYLQGNGTPFSKSDLNLRDGKSINVNIWLFMQKLDLIKKNVGLKYGLGVELNNYRFKKSSLLSFSESGSPLPGAPQLNAPFIFRDSVKSFSKNKLALDYVTVPVMLNFQTTPRLHKQTFNIAFGVSAGYLYSQRNKQVSAERGKEKNRGDYDLEKFKFSYIAELGIGPVKLYGSYSPKTMFESQTKLDVRPYTLGIRFAN